MAAALPYARTYNQAHVARPHSGGRRGQHLLDVELSVGGPA